MFVGARCLLCTNVLKTSNIGSCQGSYFQSTNQRQAYVVLRHKNRIHTESCCPIGQYISKCLAYLYTVKYVLKITMHPASSCMKNS